MEVFGLSSFYRTPHLECVNDVTAICIPDVHVATHAHNTKPENWNMY